MIRAALALTLLASPALAAPYGGPIIDTHNHWTPSRTAAKVLKLMEQHRVTATVLMARQYGDPKSKVDLPGTDLMTQELGQKYPGKFFPLVGMQLPMLTAADWSKPNEAMERLYKLTAEKLASGRFYGIGEIIIRHYPYFNHPAPEGPSQHVNKDPDTAHMRRLAAIAVQYNRPMVIHMEGEPPLVASLDRFLAKNPKLLLVWAHACGRISPALIEELLAKHRNLYCDLATMTNTYQGYGYAVGRHYPERQGWPSAFEWTFLIEENGEFFPEVKRVIERFPDRFLGVGMDNAHFEINEANYMGRITRFRELLGTLAPETAEKLAYSNAVRVFRLKPAEPELDFQTAGDVPSRSRGALAPKVSAGGPLARLRALLSCASRASPTCEGDGAPSGAPTSGGVAAFLPASQGPRLRTRRACCVAPSSEFLAHGPRIGSVHADRRTIPRESRIRSQSKARVAIRRE